MMRPSGDWRMRASVPSMFATVVTSDLLHPPPLLLPYATLVPSGDATYARPPARLLASGVIAPVWRCRKKGPEGVAGATVGGSVAGVVAFGPRRVSSINATATRATTAAIANAAFLLFRAARTCLFC